MRLGKLLLLLLLLLPAFRNTTLFDSRMLLPVSAAILPDLILSISSTTRSISR